MALKKAASKFGEKLGAAVFDEIFKGIFGSSDQVDPRALAEILEDTLEAFAEDIKLYIDNAFVKERMNSAKRNLKELTRLISLYSAAPEGSLDALDECAILANKTVSDLEALGGAAMISYVTAVTFEIAVYEERAARIHPDNRNIILKKIIPMGVAHFAAYKEKLVEHTKSRVTAFQHAGFNSETGEPEGYYVGVRVDGSTVASESNPGDFLTLEERARIQEAFEKEQKTLLKELDDRLSGTQDMVSAWLAKYPVDQEILTRTEEQIRL